MQVQSMHFKARAGEKLADARLQENLRRLSTKFVSGRAEAVTQIDFVATRAQLKARRDRALERLDVWLEMFEREAARRGTTVLYAQTTQDAAKLVADIARRHDVKKVIKTKSMVTEEANLNAVLARLGVQSIETDLGEYILQINGNEPPSHIIAPVLHRDKEEIADLFAKTHGRARLTDISEMTREAREVLRPHFLSADMGVTGGNFVIAETGSVVLVTNEGNEGMCTVLPRVHVAVTGIEKVLPTLEDLATAMRLLPRSATGQKTSNYFSLLTGVRGDGDEDGPEHAYVVLVDGGRSGLIGGEFQEMLRCIRCGACMNHCPVYQKVGGHAYGWVYPGPMGSVLTPSYIGLANALDLPQAATLCGECDSVCPVGIPISGLLRKLREKQVERRLRPWRERAALAAWAFSRGGRRCTRSRRSSGCACSSGRAVRRAAWRGCSGACRSRAAGPEVGRLRATSRPPSGGRSASCMRRRARISTRLRRADPLVLGRDCSSRDNTAFAIHGFISIDVIYRMSTSALGYARCASRERSHHEKDNIDVLAACDRRAARRRRLPVSVRSRAAARARRRARYVGRTRARGVVRVRRRCVAAVARRVARRAARRPEGAVTRHPAQAGIGAPLYNGALSIRAVRRACPAAR